MLLFFFALKYFRTLHRTGQPEFSTAPGAKLCCAQAFDFSTGAALRQALRCAAAFILYKGIVRSRFLLRACQARRGPRSVWVRSIVSLHAARWRLQLGKRVPCGQSCIGRGGSLVPPWLCFCVLAPIQVSIDRGPVRELAEQKYGLRSRCCRSADLRPFGTSRHTQRERHARRPKQHRTGAQAHLSCIGRRVQDSLCRLQRAQASRHKRHGSGRISAAGERHSSLVCIHHPGGQRISAAHRAALLAAAAF